MKKQFKLLVAVMAIAVIGIMCLVGCTPNRPDKFLLKALESDELTLSMKMGDIESTVIYGKDKYAMKTTAGIISTEAYLIKNGESYDAYLKMGSLDWQYTSIKSIEDFSIKIPKLSDILNENTEANLSKEQLEKLDKTFNDFYIKEDGKWYLKNSDDKKNANFYFEIKGNTLNMVSNNDATTLSIKLSGKVNLPSEAKAAKK